MAYIYVNDSRFQTRDSPGTVGAPIYLEVLPDGHSRHLTTLKQNDTARGLQPKKNSASAVEDRVRKANTKAPNSRGQMSQDAFLSNRNERAAPGDDERHTYDCIAGQQVNGIATVVNVPVYENRRQAHGATEERSDKEESERVVDEWYEPLSKATCTQRPEQMLYEPLKPIDEEGKNLAAGSTNCCVVWFCSHRLCVVIIASALLIVGACLAGMIGYLVHGEGVCSSSPCLNRGTCLDREDRFTCTCVPGYTGHRCETVNNYCAFNPCANGGSCSNGGNGFTCACLFGFAGKLCEIGINVALRQPATQSSSYLDDRRNYGAEQAVDGSLAILGQSYLCSHTFEENQPWWAVDLGRVINVDQVRITNRGDGDCSCCRDRLSDFTVGMTNASPWITQLPIVTEGPPCAFHRGAPAELTTTIQCDRLSLPGRYLFIRLAGKNYLTLCEVEVFARGA